MENRLILLVCGGPKNWRQDVVTALRGEYDTREGAGDPTTVELCGDGTRHPPDIVVWRLNVAEPAARETYGRLWWWAPGTKFVLVDDSGSVGNLAMACPTPEPFAFLERGATPAKLIEAIGDGAANCWWTELCHLEVPACEVSLGGRILRANPAMLQELGPLGEDCYFRVVVEGLGLDGDNVGFPEGHPIARVIDTKRACADFVDTKHGQMQMLCLPNLMGESRLGTISVLMPDTGRRAKVLDFVGGPKGQTLTAIHEYVVDCAVQLGFKRARLYRLDEERRAFRGVAARGFRDPKRHRYFVEKFRMPIDLDLPSRHVLDTHLPSVCLHDPERKHVEKASRFVRVYTNRKRRAFARLLELQGANRWIEAPLVVPGTEQVVGKIVVDKAEESGSLCVRDALDLGSLAMMAAGVIYAVEQNQALTYHNRVLKEIHDLLPTLAVERNELCFYRLIATLLSCDHGLRWEQVMLFVVDPTGLNQARCVMAVGGHTEGERQRLRSEFHTLQEYVKRARKNPKPQGDYLYDAWVECAAEEPQVIKFGEAKTHAAPLAKLLASPTEKGWLTINVPEDPWCQRINEDVPDTFKGKQVFAYPLTKSFAQGIELGATMPATQPVGVALVGMIGEQRHVDPHALVFTRAVLDLLGPLIALRWIGQRIEGMFGALYPLHHSHLNSSWEEFRDAADECVRRPDDDSARGTYLAKLDSHEKEVQRILFALSTLASLGGANERCVDLASCLADYQKRWEAEWSGQEGRCELEVIVGPVREALRLDCDPVVLCDAMTCVVRNATEAGARSRQHRVRLEITVGDFRGSADFTEILIADDAGGVDEAIVPLLFVKGVSGRPKGRGAGLALARSALLMYSGDLQYVPEDSSRGATFRILVRKAKRPAGVQLESQ